MTAVGWAQSCASPETNSSRERASCTPVGWRGCCAFGALRRLPLAPPRRGGAPRLWPLQPLGATLPAGILPPRWLASIVRRLTRSPRLPLRRRAGGRGARRGRAAGAGGAGRAARGLGAGAVRLRAGGRLARRAVLRQGGLVHLQLRARGLLGARAPRPGAQPALAQTGSAASALCAGELRGACLSGARLSDPPLVVGCGAGVYRARVHSRRPHHGSATAHPRRRVSRLSV